MFRYTLFYKYISKQHNIVSIIYMLMQHKKSDNVYTQMPGQVHFPPIFKFFVPIISRKPKQSRNKDIHLHTQKNYK